MSEALDTTMMASMREAIKSLLPDKCSILRKTSTPDGMGGMLDTYAATDTGIPFRLDEVAGSEIVSGGGMQYFEKYTGSLPFDTSINVEDKIICNGVSFIVKALSSSPKSWSAVVRVELERI